MHRADTRVAIGDMGGVERGIGTIGIAPTEVLSYTLYSSIQKPSIAIVRRKER